jgi:hypothetical protein
VGVGEPPAVFSEPVDVRRRDELGPVAAEVAVADVVGQDDHDVRLAGGVSGRCARGNES